MNVLFQTPLKGKIAITSNFENQVELQKDKTLYKFIWVKEGSVTLEVDHVEMTLDTNDIISLTPFHLLTIKEVRGSYLTFLFNSNFYCIFGHDNEVSCNGFLFHGSSDVMLLHITAEHAAELSNILTLFHAECYIKDNLQEETLRILLKYFIISCTRIARERYQITQEKEKSFDLVRKFYVLVDQHFKEKKQVQDYADLLHRSPKTLSHLFASYGLPTPMRVIRERIEAEAKRLLIHTNKSAKEIGDILGFEDNSSFSRFFRTMTGESIFDYRRREKQVDK